MAGWSKPSPHIVKVNCKGVFDRQKMRVSVGCVMRDNKGERVKGASGMIGLVISVGAELWSIFYGLKLAWEKGDVKDVIIECDCQQAVSEVEHPKPDFWLADLVMLIKNLENEAWNSCVIQHVATDCNAAATALANSGVDGDDGITEHDVVPAVLEVIVVAEKA